MPEKQWLQMRGEVRRQSGELTNNNVSRIPGSSEN